MPTPKRHCRTMRRNPFPSKFAPRGSSQPIRGKLDRIKMTTEQRELIDRIVVGLFIDLQNEPLADILTACYVTGLNHGVRGLTDDDIVSGRRNDIAKEALQNDD